MRTLVKQSWAFREGLLSRLEECKLEVQRPLGSDKNLQRPGANDESQKS